MYCRVFDAFDNHFHQIHTVTKKKDLTRCTSKITSAIVAGPKRSGKTTWVARLLQNGLRHIKPVPPRITWC